MIIDLASVGKEPRPIAAAFEPHEIEIDENTPLARAAEFRGEIARGSDERTRVSGHISAAVSATCARCLTPLEVPIDIDFEDIFADASTEPSSDELEIQAGDLDESLISGSELDLAEIVREQIVLASGETTLCQEDCRGLCSKCGENRNLIDCKCEDDEIDPRWAALKNLN